MVLPDYYDYINILAFQYLYQYENKKSISIETLHKFRKALIEEVLDNYKKDGNQNYFLERDHWYGKISFQEVDCNQKIEKFLKDYENLFDRNGNNIVLRKEISYEDIKQLEYNLRIKENISHRIDIISSTPKLIKMLGIETIDKVINNYLKVEQQLEKKYKQLYTFKDDGKLRKEIKELLNVRSLFYIKIACLPKERIEAFKDFGLSFDKHEQSDYEKLPINIELFEQSEYFDEENFMTELDDRIYDIYQYAIFGNTKNKLFEEKLEEDLAKMYFFETINKENLDFDVTMNFIENIDSINTLMPLENIEETQTLDDNDQPSILYFFDSSEEEWIFNLSYLDKLNKYMKKYGENESLLLTKRRLLYALDQPGKKIFEQENFEKELANLDFDEIDEESFEFFQDEYFFLADEVFETKEDENTVKKLLLISTYYDLTKNEEIVDIINEHKDHEAYDKYCEIIFGEEKGKRIVKQR